ncbi:hypothetical protein [Apilactobacillus ozensis]
MDAVKQSIAALDAEMAQLQQELDAMTADLVETDVNSNEHKE